MTETNLAAPDVVLRAEGLGACPDGTSAYTRLVYRVAHECLLNSQRHAHAGRVDVRLARHPDGQGAAILEVVDNGSGFDAADAVAHPPEGHFGLRVLSDVARDAGVDLRVRSARGVGTHWQLRIQPA